MVRRSTWIVLGVFVALVLSVFLWQRYGKPEEAVEPTPTLKVFSLVFNLGSQTITSFSIEGADGTLITFGRDPASDAWIVVDQPAELADSTQIETVASSLAFMTVNSILSTQPPLDSMGLDKPAYTITLYLDNGGQNVLYVGNLTPTGSGYYARVDDDPAVVVGKIDMDAILNLHKAPPLAATYTPTVTSTATMTATNTSTAIPTLTSTPEETPEPEMTTTPTP